MPSTHNQLRRLFHNALGIRLVVIFVYQESEDVEMGFVVSFCNEPC